MEYTTLTEHQNVNTTKTNNEAMETSKKGKNAYVQYILFVC